MRQPETIQPSGFYLLGWAQADKSRGAIHISHLTDSQKRPYSLSVWPYLLKSKIHPAGDPVPIAEPDTWACGPGQSRFSLRHFQRSGISGDEVLV